MRFLACILFLLGACLGDEVLSSLDEHFAMMYLEENPPILRQLDKKRVEFVLSKAETIDLFALTLKTEITSDKAFFLELDGVYVEYSNRMRLDERSRSVFREVMGKVLSTAPSARKIDSFNPSVGFRLYSKQNVVLLEGSISGPPDGAVKGRIGNQAFSVEGLDSTLVKAVLDLCRNREADSKR
jgi:hypothetical protein